MSDLKADSTFNEAAFAREYESIWSGSVEDAFFDGDAFDKNRILLQPEYEYSGRSTAQSYYILSMDVGRRNCDSVICVIKVRPQAHGSAIKSLVNMYTKNDAHFEDQAIWAKKLFYKYRARRLVVDGNGLGMGLVDYLVKAQIDPVSGDVLPPFGVYNDNDGEYRKYHTPDTEDNALYVMKANAPINTEMYTTLQSQITSGKLKMLISEQVARAKLLGTKQGQKMTPEERSEYLKPFSLTSVLKEELLDLAS